MHFQTGGMVPTLLEPGEKVFMPGDWDSSISTLNSMIPRFQTGGLVEVSNPLTAAENSPSVYLRVLGSLLLIQHSRRLSAGHPQAGKTSDITSLKVLSLTVLGLLPLLQPPDWSCRK